MKRIVAILTLGLCSLSTFSEPELKGNPQELRHFLHPTANLVTISGESEEKAYSDTAIISLTIATENKLLSKAISSNSELRDRITTTLVDKGIPVESIKSSKFSSSPQYGFFGGKPSSYKVINRLAITIVQEQHLKEIAVISDTFKEADISDTSFEHTLKDEFNKRVNAKALEKIIAKKTYYEITLGLVLTPVGIRESRISESATSGAMAREEIVVSAMRAETDSYSSKARHPRTQQPSFDEVKYEAHLAIDYKIESKP